MSTALKDNHNTPPFLLSRNFSSFSSQFSILSILVSQPAILLNYIGQFQNYIFSSLCLLIYPFPLHQALPIEASTADVLWDLLEPV